MKKNVKILGATAAALLAVAPVVASATPANAAMSFNQSNPTNPAVSQSTLNFNLTSSGNASSTANDVIRNLSATTDHGDLSYTSANVQMNNNTSLMSGGQQMTSGNTFRIVLGGVKVAHLDATQHYNIAGGYLVANGSPTHVTSATGSQLSSGNYTFYSDPFFVTNTDPNSPTANDAPYFYLRSDTQQPGNPGRPIPAGTTANWNGGLVFTNNQTSVDAVWDLVTSSTNSPVMIRNGVLTTSYATVREQIAKQATVDANGAFYVPKGGFDVTLTATNPANGKTTTVTVHMYNRDAATHSPYPIIYQNGTKVAQTNGTDLHQVDPIIVKGGSNFNPIKTPKITAAVSSNDNAQLQLSSLSTVSNPVNTNVPGVYNVTVRATNPAGLSTDYTYEVVVTSADPNAAHPVTVHYVPGYGVNVWAVYGNSRAFTGARVQDGQKLTAFETRNVNGVSYTRISTDTDTTTATRDNTWIPTEFLSAHNSSNTNTNKPSNNNGEKAISGTARVTFNGKGSVKLLNANGRHVDQYVKKGSTWKVWAEKTVNGIHMYRIGNQNQWVPADYVTLN